MTEARDSSFTRPPPAPLSANEECARARDVAARAHAGQRDKAGEPYFEHCQRVADAVVGEKAKSVAFLHDVLEKAPGWTPERLSELGISAEVISAVRVLTIQPGETKDALALRATSNPLSLTVKRADLQDNLAQVESQGESGADYRRRLQLLDEASQRDVAPLELRNDGELADPPSAGSSGDLGRWRIPGADITVGARSVLATLLGLFVAAAVLAVWILASR